MKLELVIFDMDGLMFDTEMVYYKAFIRGLKEFNLEFDNDVFLSSIGTSFIKTHEILTERYGRFVDIDTLLDKVNSYKDDIVLTEGLPIKTGVLELIEFLDENGIKKAIASSSFREIILENLKISGIKNDFDYIISGAELKASKPDPEIFTKTCADLEIHRDNAIVLEDSLNGLRAAYSAGIKCIVVPDMLPPDAEMREKAWRIEENLLIVRDLVKEIMGG
ncbi:MAG: HAD family phosphatase [Defluviitaleaceae bacterium]|nr:HAD family phosphatase [Defluviitaleaceae bacterium]